MLIWLLCKILYRAVQRLYCSIVTNIPSSSFTVRLRLQAEATGGARQPYFLGVPALSPSVASYSTLVDVWTDLDPLRATEIVDRMTSYGLAPAYQVRGI